MVTHGRRYAEAETAARAATDRPGVAGGSDLPGGPSGPGLSGLTDPGGVTDPGGLGGPGLSGLTDAGGLTGPGGLYVHAYNDPAVIAGQGTVGLEIAEQAPETDAVVAAVGGGGLAAGVGAAIGTERTLVAVEPENCDCLHRAFAAGGPVEAPTESVAASALGASRVGDLPFAMLRQRPVELVHVADAEILAARDRLWEELRIAVEPGAAAPFAAWLAGRVPGRRPCLVLCGANDDWRPPA